MKLGLVQNVQQRQELRLSPQILQRIEVLQLPALDLADMIEAELQENDALELDRELEPETQVDEGPEDDGADLEALYDDEDWRPRNDGADPISRTDVLEASAAAPVTLSEHLRSQLDHEALGPRRSAIVEAIIEALNDRGWLDLPLAELEVDLDPAADEEEKEHALHVVQGLDPAGVGCRDMVECLLLQLDTTAADYQLLATLVLGHLDDIARNRIPAIVRETGQSVDTVLAAIDRISHLDPVPGRRFGRNEVPHVRPDIMVQRVGDDYEISLENDWIPSLRLSRSYIEMAGDRRVDSDLRQHIRAKIESARSLMDAIAQRKHTLFRVASEIVDRQLEFVEHGRAALKPLRMQEVADVLGLHVSTISRAISGKSIQTPRGIFPLKELFTGEVPATSGAGGEGASRASVQELVRGIIDAEDKAHPLSDEAIVTKLSKEHGLEIARRTVTKYRKALGLGSSRARRVYR